MFSSVGGDTDVETDLVDTRLGDIICSSIHVESHDIDIRILDDVAALRVHDVDDISYFKIIPRNIGNLNDVINVVEVPVLIKEVLGVVLLIGTLLVEFEVLQLGIYYSSPLSLHCTKLINSTILVH